MIFTLARLTCYGRHVVSCRGRCATRYLICLSLLVLATPGVRAESDRQALLTRKPLAVSSVQALPSKKKPEGAENVVAMVRDPVAEDPLSYYARQIDGQWYIPLTVDREDPWVRLLVLGPSQPLLVDIALLVDGQPFREAREQWVDLLLEQARNKSLVAGALEVSADEVPTDSDSAKDVEKSGDEKSEQETAEEDEAGEDEAEEDKNESAENAGDDKAEDDEEDGTEEDDAAEKVPTTKVRMREAPTVVQRLITYLAVDGAEEDREEIRWLIAEWTDGPALLVLGPAFSWQRAKIAPLWNCLDRDHDRLLSASEVSEASDRLRQADVDEDEVVDLKEIERLSETRSPYLREMSHPLVVVLNEGTAWKTLSSHLKSLYGSDGSNPSEEAAATLMARVRRGDSSLSGSDLAGLLYVPSEIVYRVDLGKEDGKVSLLAIGADQKDPESLVSATDQVITVNQSSDYLELSAARGEAKSKLDLRHTQIAIGAVVDGYPLFRLLDRDNDRRLTLREQRRLKDCLVACDLNGDGQIDNLEIPTAIRLTVTHGLHVHEILRLPTAAVREIGDEESQESEAAPAWFAQMDRNRDGDLSRVEFLGTSVQFKQFDRDHDGLISKKEVQEK